MKAKPAGESLRLSATRYAASDEEKCDALNFFSVYTQVILNAPFNTQAI